MLALGLDPSSTGRFCLDHLVHGTDVKFQDAAEKLGVSVQSEYGPERSNVTTPPFLS